MKRFFLIIIITSFSMILNAQEIDKIIAIVGDEIVLRSEVENQYLHAFRKELLEMRSLDVKFLKI